MARSAIVGDPLDEHTMVGPLVSAAHRDRVERYIQPRPVQRRPAHHRRRPTRRPTRPAGSSNRPCSTDVDNRDLLAREEIFGPVLTITPYADEDEAIRLANDTDRTPVGQRCAFKLEVQAECPL